MFSLRDQELSPTTLTCFRHSLQQAVSRDACCPPRQVFSINPEGCWRFHTEDPSGLVLMGKLWKASHHSTIEIILNLMSL